ncbi:MAG: hypothetical protein V4731_10385 [Pseudomonadota bacterium]
MNLAPLVADVVGWSAAALTLLAFSCNNILRLRYLALAANVAFIAYGLMAGLWPVLVLHFALVPINVWRLLQTTRINVKATDGMRASRLPALVADAD